MFIILRLQGSRRYIYIRMILSWLDVKRRTCAQWLQFLSKVDNLNVSQLHSIVNLSIGLFLIPVALSLILVRKFAELQVQLPLA